MADQNLNQLAAAADLADGDLFHVVDISDPTMSGSGTDKKLTRANFWAFNFVTPSAGTYSGAEYAKVAPSSASANISLVLAPKGTGGIQAQAADGVASGGNNRGSKAVDLQQDRLAATEVASGNYSTIAGGYRNIASGLYSFAAGYGNHATGSYSLALGSASVASKFGQLSLGSGGITGTPQASMLVASITTSNGTQTELFLDGTAATQRLTIVNDTTWAFEILVVARRVDAGDESAAYKFSGCVRRGANAASTTVVGVVDKSVIAEDTVAWDVDVDADTTNGSLRIQVTGEVAKDIYWVARVDTVEISEISQ